MNKHRNNNNNKKNVKKLNCGENKAPRRVFHFNSFNPSIHHKSESDFI